MFVIHIPSGTITEDNDINEIIHDFEDDNEGNKFMFLLLGKRE